MKARFLAVPVLLVGSAAVAHVVLTMRGVHFKTDRIDFGQPPARRRLGFDDGTGYAGRDGAWRPGTKYRRDPWDGEYGKDYEARYKSLQELARRLPKAAARAELAGRYDEALRDDAKLLAMGLMSPNFVASRRELFATPGLAGTRGLRAYLRATNPATRGPLPTDAGPTLRPWVAYDRASSPADYEAVAKAHPGSSRAPAALIMAARGLANSNGSPAPEAVHRARRAAETILRDYPGSRFVWDAEGILGRIEALKGHYAAATPFYETQVRTADTPARLQRAFDSVIACARTTGDRSAVAYAALRWADAADPGDPYVARAFLYRTLGRFSGGDAPAFYCRLAGDPRAFAAYLDFRSSIQSDAPDLLALAENARRATAGTVYRGRVDAVLAEVALAANDGRARLFAQGALDGRPADRAVGRFVIATIDRRGGRLAEARRGYAEVVASGTYLAGGARECLAVVDERLGDLAGALDQYRALNYSEDVAYLADVRMSPPVLAAYVARHPEAQDLRYTLAMRYLRRGEWDAAERALRPLGATERRRLTSESLDRWTRQDGGLQDPLATVRALRKLDRAVKAAKGPEATAAALAAMGDYYYRHKCLLLYSAPAWQGGRDYTIAFSWNTAVNTPADDAALRAHYDEHECYTQALRRYRRVVAEFPNTKVAAHAAYWGGVAAERLSHMAPYWRWRERWDDRQGEAVHLLALAAKSPNAALAAKARKYAKVFADQRAETRKAFASEKPPTRTWDPFAG